MIIKKWTGSAWAEQYPKTTIADVYLADGTTAAFANNKIALTLLPNSVFDSLQFKTVLAGNASSSNVAIAIEDAINDADSNNRSAVGFYFVINAAGTISQQTTSVQTTLGDNEYYQWTFENNDAGQTSVTSSGALEVGDWIVITSVTGSGTSGSPYVVRFGVVNNTYEVATSTAPGIIELGSDTVQTVAANAVSATSSRTYALQLNSAGQAVVNVPWSDTNTTYSVASTSTLGLVKIVDGTTQTVAANGVTATASRSYAVQLNASQQMVVNVPWTDTNTTYSEATSSTLGLVKIGYTENGKNYPVELSSGQMFVNVPWTDSNTTYTAGVGLTLTGTEFKMENPIEIGTTTPSSGYQVTNGALWFDLS